MNSNTFTWYKWQRYERIECRENPPSHLPSPAMRQVICVLPVYYQLLASSLRDSLLCRQIFVYVYFLLKYINGSILHAQFCDCVNKTIYLGDCLISFHKELLTFSIAAHYSITQLLSHVPRWWVSCPPVMSV